MALGCLYLQLSVLVAEGTKSPLLCGHLKNNLSQSATAHNAVSVWALGAEGDQLAELMRIFGHSD